MFVFGVPVGTLLLLVLPISLSTTLVRANTRNNEHDPSWQSVRKLAADPNPRVLNVHVVPHTHDDVGWRKTVEQYYYGLNTSIDERGAVNRILSSAVQALTENTARTFTYAEVKFFSMWWNEQNDATKDTVRYLIATQQWTFVNGGWCMHDEATSHFMGMLDQTTLGHQFLLRELGVRPVTGWQLDPFGHSATQANLLTYKAGMDALYFGRIDYQDLERRKLSQECEGLWESAVDNKEETVFWGLTGSYGGNYGPPPGFCFDLLCDDEWLVGVNTTRLLERVTEFMHYVSIQSVQTKGNHIMMTMGEDFTFKEAHVDYSNLDLLIGACMNYQQWNMINVSSIVGSGFDRVNVFYSNPDYYTEQKYAESLDSQVTWPTKTGDFFPYSDCPHCFWTGYFASRVAFKRFERFASSFLMAARQIIAMPGPSDEHDDDNALTRLEDALGIAQHHDAISGTAKQHVADDYSKKLSDGMNDAVPHVIRKLKQLMLQDPSKWSRPEVEALDNLSYCPLLNETICQPSMDASSLNDTTIYVVVYNSLAQARFTNIRLPVAPGLFRVERIDGRQESIQYTRSIPIGSSVKSGRLDQNHVLVISTGELPPLGAVAFRIVKEEPVESFAGEQSDTVSMSTIRTRRLFHVKSETIEVSNNKIKAEFDASTGALLSMSSNGGPSLAINQTWGYYESFDATLDSQDENDQSSGAYIFRPRGAEMHPLPFVPRAGGAQFIPTMNGMDIVVSFREPYVQQVFRVMEGKSFIEVEYTVGPVDTSDGRGKEIITRWTTPIKNNGVFYTDANAREFQKRQRDFRQSWDLKVFEPVAGNYYPVNAAIYIEDDKSAFAVLVDRSLGGSSLIDGSVEIMIQRRTLVDDHRGVDEALNETSGGMSPYPPFGINERIGAGVVVGGKHRIAVGEGPVGAALARLEMDSMFAEPIVFVGSALSIDQVAFKNATFAGLTTELPPNVMLITFTRFPGSTFFLRFAHQFAVGEDETLGQPVEIDIARLFRGYIIEGVIETTLSGNEAWRDRLSRGKNWIDQPSTFASSATTKITLAPMEIKTFLVKI